MAQLNIVADLQFGSTGKGALAYALGEFLRPDVVVTAWGPNAGHTAQSVDGHKWVNTMLANSMVCESVRTQLIGPGSVVNLASLLNEAKAAAPWLRGKSIVIHPAACILTPEHAEAEKKLVRVGSTMKGTAAALIDKMWRDALRSPLARDLPDHVEEFYIREFAAFDVAFHISENSYNMVTDNSQSLLLEGCQGFSLGVHTQFWPHTTSRDISPAQMIADCRLPFALAADAVVWGTARTFPIRVANRFDENGFKIGSSGGCYPDQHELRWREDLGREPELTTVTKLPRRIFTFSEAQVFEAARICMPARVVLTFCDYLGEKPAEGESPNEAILTLVDRIEDVTDAPVQILTFGPSVADTIVLNGFHRAHPLTFDTFHGLL